ncbi:hypothetical protein BT96DRAFT_396353 [Gymnopus androsaceus JB14]|uniref:Uncharacterized protein n=1 Tax=Gymnopus androsaceus JB14 TaxID=1447944 RepID=A0A6A4I2U5_9AGAR|nr:hypothetical protein BT96DRAFT_396353 [Gymnopus androsaceus JB14]
MVRMNRYHNGMSLSNSTLWCLGGCPPRLHSSRIFTNHASQAQVQVRLRLRIHISLSSFISFISRIWRPSGSLSSTWYFALITRVNCSSYLYRLQISISPPQRLWSVGLALHFDDLLTADLLVPLPALLLANTCTHRLWVLFSIPITVLFGVECSMFIRLRALDVARPSKDSRVGRSETVHCVCIYFAASFIS